MEIQVLDGRYLDVKLLKELLKRLFGTNYVAEVLPYSSVQMTRYVD